MNQTTINVHERLESLVARRNQRRIEILKDVRFRKLRTVKWHQYVAFK